MPNIRWLLALITSVHRFLYRASGGRVGARVWRFQFLLLEHVGRRSGRRYVAPLLYVEDGDRFVVVASNAGHTRDPAWWGNLKANPAARVQVGTRQLDVRARAALGEERARIWPHLLERWPEYAHYEQRAARPIPVVLLEPTGAPGLPSTSPPRQ